MKQAKTMYEKDSKQRPNNHKFCLLLLGRVVCLTQFAIFHLHRCSTQQLAPETMRAYGMASTGDKLSAIRCIQKPSPMDTAARSH
jgi:hypothetical protein